MTRKIKPKSTTINIIFSFSTCLFPLTYSSTTFPLSSLCSLSSMVELRRTSATTAMGFIFLRSCFMGFIFMWFWLWVHLISFVLASVLVLASVSAVWSKSKKRAGGGLERMELDLSLYPGLGLHLSQNGAQSRPPPSPLMIAKSLFLSFFWSTMVLVGLVTLLAWVCWLISGFGDWFSGFGDWLVGWIFGLVGGVVVVWLCWSVVVGFGFYFGFDCVGLGLIWVWLCFSGFVVIGFLIWVWFELVCLLGLWVWFAENLVLIVLEFGEEHEEFEEPVVKWRTSWRTLRNIFWF